MRKQSWAKKLVASASSLALAAALLPAAAIPAFAAEGDNGGADITTIDYEADSSATATYDLKNLFTDSFVAADKSSKAAIIKVKDDATTKITSKALGAMIDKGWFEIDGYSDASTVKWKWLFNASKTYTAADLESGASYNLQITAQSADSKTSSVTVPDVKPLLSKAVNPTVFFKTEQNDSMFLACTAKKTYGALNSGGFAALASLRESGTFTISASDFKIDVRDAVTGESKTAKTLTTDELTTLAKSDVQNYLYNASGATVFSTNKYIEIKELFKGIDEWKNGSKLEVTCADGPYTKSTPSYEEIQADGYYYSEYNAKGDTYKAENKVAVPAVFALQQASVKLPTDSNTTAADAVSKAITAGDYSQEGCLRIFRGLPAAPASADDLLKGMTSPASIFGATIVYQHDLSNDISVAAIADQTYTGKAIEPAVNVSVKDGSAIAGKTLVKDTDYKVSFSNNTNAGTATAKVEGMGNYTGSATVKFNIKAADLSKATVTAAAQTFANKNLTPAPTVKLGNTTLKKGSDYTVSYSNNKNAGTATVTITGKGNYAGTAKGSFKINPAAQTITAKNVTKTYKGKKLVKKKKLAKKQTFKLSAKAKTGVSFKKTSGDSKITVDPKTGKVTVKKGAKKGKHTATITVTAKKNANYKQATTKIKVTVVVK